MSNHSILSIEDDPDTREMYRDVLEEAGYTVMTAVDGQEGLQKSTHDPYDLIILDIMMPKLDGIAFLKQLKQSTATKKPPIITMTNLANDAVTDEALTLGATECLIKSDIDPDQLVKRVNLLVN